jgi:superfamily II DNA/RNA helicase
MENFDGLSLPPALAKSLAAMHYKIPTPIQVQAIPLGLQGRDILGSAQTGTGKTAAFGIPLVARLLANPRGSALVLLPTRELAVQVLDVLNQLLGKHSGINSVLLIGGEPMPRQLNQLRLRPRLIVGTPGRINDHLERGSLMLHEASFLVLDETDRMLDMGFAVQLERIFKFLPKTRQTLMFSATLPAEIVKLSQKYLVNPERIAVGGVSKPAANVQQEIMRLSQADKFPALLRELDKREGSVIIFVKTKRGADRLAEKLTREKHSADAIHGDLQQRKREKVIQAFRDMKHRIMVATDIAARGLDIPHIEHVINYDLPQCPEDYIHRIGRTARAGATGASLCFIAPDDDEKWREIHRLLHPGEAPLPRRTPEGGSSSNGNGGNRRRFGSGNGGNGGGNAPSGENRPRRARRRRPAMKMAA